MRTQPFSILRPFEDDLHVALFAKQDDIGSDDAAAKALGASMAAGLCQSHGKETVVVRGPTAREIRADGMLTETPSLALCTRWADCQNFVIYLPEKKVLGVLHAGWRGLVAGAIPAFFDVLHSEWGIDASHAFVGAGPSLCTRCADFSHPETELPGLPADLRNGKHADLRGWAEQQFHAAGVQEDRFERLPGCTRCEPEIYWTYRGGHREEVKAKHTNMLAAAIRSPAGSA